MTRRESTASDAGGSGGGGSGGRLVPDSISSVPVRSIHGQLAVGNHQSLAWSCNGLLAFGCQTQVIVADTQRLQVIQTLDRHKHLVSMARWPTDASTRLASADIKANIVVWDVIEGTVLTAIAGDAKELKSILSMEWLKGTSNGKNPTGAYILVLYAANTLVLYDTEQGDAIWKKNFAATAAVEYSLKHMSLDPFTKSSASMSLTATSAQNVHCCFAQFDGLMSSSVRIRRYQLYVHNDGQSAATAAATANSPLKSPRMQLAIKQVATGLGKSDQEVASNYMLEYKSLTANKARRHEVIFLFAREIVIVSLQNVQIMTVIATERNSSPVVELYACRQRCGLYSLHESGNVIFRLQQASARFEDHINTTVTELTYTTVCHSEGIRLTKQNRIVGFAVAPGCETRVALLLNNGRVLIKQIVKRIADDGDDDHGRSLSLADLFPLDYYNAKLAEQHQLKEKYKLVQSQLMGALLTPTIIKSCPPITKYNWRHHRPLLAVGDTSGSIQIYALSSGRLEKEFAVHSSPVRGLEWVSLNAFISFSYPNLPRNNAAKVNNELLLTDIPSGRSELVRQDRNLNSAPIEAIRVSHLKQYFILTFKHEPFEIWDLKSLCLLRVMPKKFASVTAVEWSPLYNKKQANPALKSRDSLDEEPTPTSTTATPTVSTIVDETGDSLVTPDITRQMLAIKENFVVTNGHGELFHFSVEGNITKEISCIPRDASHGQITCIAWKGDQVILGDADGNLHYWDLKKKQSSTKTSHRGWVKKVRFGPGRGNMKCIVLYSDGVEIWDVAEMSVYSELKAPRDVAFKLLDVDWAGSDRPIMATSDGFVLVTDLRLRKYSSPIELTLTPKDGLFDCNLHLSEPMSRTVAITTYLHKHGEQDSGKLLQHCIQVAKLMGDRAAIDFWQLAGHHILSDEQSAYSRLDDNYELFVKNECYREVQAARVSAFEPKRSTQEHNELCVEYHVLLGNHQRAVQLLLESDTQSRDKYYKDALRACLIAALNSNANCKSTAKSTADTNDDNSPQPVLKLVATSLIASGAVEEGVQLLYLIGKVQDACRYLQSNGFWEKSVWVAKTYLTDDESQEIVRKWLDHLILQNEREVQLQVLLSMRQFEKVLETLTNRQELQVAALFADICTANDVLPSEAKVTVDFVYLKYAQFLIECGLDEIAERYKDKVSE